MSCGWGRYEIFFSVASGAKKSREKMVEWLTRHENTTYLAEVGGEFDYELILLAQSSLQVHEILGETARRCGEISFLKVVAVHNRVHYFARKYLAPSVSDVSSLSLVGSPLVGKAQDGSVFQVQISDIEHQILLHLTSTPEISQREIARLIGCTPFTVTTHIERLRSVGVIRGAMYSFKGTSIGAQSYIFLIYARGFSLEFTQKLYRFCSVHPHCTNMKECFGSWDFEVGVEVIEHISLQRVKEQLLELFSKEILSITILPRFSTLKFNFYPLHRDKRARDR
jgi:DNA-binding Lrp family transcriptional regulator